MKKLFSLVCTCLLAMSMQAAETDKYDALYENLPFQMEKVTRPQFPDNEVNLKDFGAVGDGSTLCTDAFSKAIEALSQKGGGKLIVPQGVWFTGPITLKSNINLHIEKGGIILFSPDDALYPFVKTSFARWCLQAQGLLVPIRRCTQSRQQRQHERASRTCYRRRMERNQAFPPPRHGKLGKL